MERNIFVEIWGFSQLWVFLAFSGPIEHCAMVFFHPPIRCAINNRQPEKAELKRAEAEESHKEEPVSWRGKKSIKS